MHKPAILVAAIAIQAALAERVDAQQSQSRNSFSIGLIGVYGTNPYIGEDDDITPLPLIEYRADRFTIGTRGLSYEVFQGEQLSFSTGITPRFSGLADTDAPELAGIDREITADAFLGMEYRFGNGFSAEATLRQEITGEHDGQEIHIELGYGTQLGQFGVSLAAGAKWQSADLANYTWGVMPSEAIAGRAAYDTGDVTIPYLSISSARQINENWTIIGSVQAEFLPSEVADSPIVDEDSLLSVVLGVSYNF